MAYYVKNNEMIQYEREWTKKNSQKPPRQCELAAASPETLWLDLSTGFVFVFFLKSR